MKLFGFITKSFVVLALCVGPSGCLLVLAVGDCTTCKAGATVAAGSLSYSGAGLSTTVTKTIGLNSGAQSFSASASAALTSFQLDPSSPALPAGLTLSTSTGQISGTPAATASENTYTVVGTGSVGSASASFKLRVVNYVVNTTNDTSDLVAGNSICLDGGGNCSLRAAVEESNAAGGTQSIFLPIGTYTLGSTIAISDSIELYGEGGALEAPGSRAEISGGNAVRLFSTGDYRTKSLTFSGLVLKNGSVAGNGGALTGFAGTYVFSNVRFASNTASEGGALWLYHNYQPGDPTYYPVITISRSSFVSNSSTGAGTSGAIMAIYPNPITIEDSHFDTNSALGPGGALCTLNGPVTIRRSSFRANSSAGQGAAMRLDGANALIENSTFYENSAASSGAILTNNGGTLVLRFSTIYNNTVTATPSYDSAGLHVQSGATLTSINHVILANNKLGDNSPGNCNSTLSAGISLGYNSTDQDSSATNRCFSTTPDPTDLEGSDSQFISCGPALTGLTHVCTIGAASPAANSGGTTALCTGTDQVGTARPSGAACERGAYEIP